MRVLGIETSCDETGIALVDARAGVLAQALHSQVSMHERYGGVVPELASRDHMVRLLPLIDRVLGEAQCTLAAVDAIAFTQGPGLAGALLTGASVAAGAAFALGKPLIGVHHLEGHLLSPLLSPDPPTFPFVALLVSGGHTQLMRVDGLGRYTLLGDTVDDAAGEAFDKSAKLLGLGYPGGPALARLADSAQDHGARTDGRRASDRAAPLPRPKLHSGDLDFSFSGLKTAVALRVRAGLASDEDRAALASEIQHAIVEVLVAKSLAALGATGLSTLVVAGGVSANRMLRQQLGAQPGVRVHFPEPLLCTDNGAMIAFAGAMRLAARLGGEQLRSPAQLRERGFDVRPRWALDAIASPASVSSP